MPRTVYTYKPTDEEVWAWIGQKIATRAYIGTGTRTPWGKRRIAGGLCAELDGLRDSGLISLEQISRLHRAMLRVGKQTGVYTPNMYWWPLNAAGDRQRHRFCWSMMYDAAAFDGMHYESMVP